MNAAGGSAIQQLGRQFGLSEGQTQMAVGALLPALTGALNQNTQSQDGLSGLLGALSRGNHEQYLNDPSLLGQQETVQDGNGILGHLFGSKEVSRRVASHASAQTGIGSDVLKAMLPVVATMVMGSLSRGTRQQEPEQQPQGLLGMLTPMLDSNRDGSAMDDILGMATQFLMNRR